MPKAIKVRLYPTNEQAEKFTQLMGCSRWWYNCALNLCNQTHKEKGKELNRSAINTYLPSLKVKSKLLL